MAEIQQNLLKNQTKYPTKKILKDFEPKATKFKEKLKEINNKKIANYEKTYIIDYGYCDGDDPLAVQERS